MDLLWCCVILGFVGILALCVCPSDFLVCPTKFFLGFSYFVAFFVVVFLGISHFVGNFHF